MPLQINQPVESDFRNPIGLLTDCHRRIERFLNVLLTIAKQFVGQELDNERRQAFEVALRYFRDAAPLHTFDEESSLFPRLREKRNSDNENDLALLDDLHTEHCSAGNFHLEIDRLGQRWLNDRQLPPEDASRLINLLEDLSAAYTAHISLEELRVFPLAGSLLNVTELNAIAEEMAARREVNFTP